MNKQQSSSSSEEESTTEITPAKTGNESREEEGHGEDELKVPPVLESNDRVAGQVADVGDTGFPPGLHDHPANMRPEQTVVGSVGVEVGIGVPVVGTVTSRPPLDGALDGTSTSHGEEVFKRLGGIIGTMRPETMVSRSDSQSDLEGVELVSIPL